MQPSGRLIKNIARKVFDLYKPLKQDEELRGRINVLCISGLIYYVFYTAYATAWFNFPAYFFFLYAFAILPWVISTIPILRVFIYLFKRRFIPREIFWLLPAFLFTRIAPEIIATTYDFGSIYFFRMRFNLLIEIIVLAGRIIPIVIGVWIVLNYRKISEKKKYNTNETANISKAVAKLLDSDQFLTSLRSVLPKGENDKEYGLDYIPYMLNDNEMRLKDLKKTTRFYFSLTLIVGVFITLVVVYFGYVIVNEEAAGLPRNVAEVNRSLERVSDDVSIIFSSELGDFQNLSASRAPNLSGLIDASVRHNFRNDAVDRITEAISADARETLNTGEWDNLAEFLQAQLAVLREMDIEDSSEREALQTYTNVLSETIETVRNFVRTREIALINLVDTTEDLQDIISKIEDSIDSEEARTSELIKRLGLSLIVASFLLAVLRYISGIYKDHYQDMRRVQYEAQVIRRFYIALKGSFKAKEGSTPNKIIADFVNSSQSVYKKDELLIKDELGNDLNADIIKEILKFLSKRSS